MTYPKHWALVPIPSGSKGPTRKGWNLRENCQLPRGWTGNVGLAHAYSGTCALDIDRQSEAFDYLAGHGIDLETLLAAPDAVQISSGREGRAKLLYRLPEPLPSKQLAKGALELRCATADGLTVQDVLPPSVHPDTGQPYTWIGDHTQIPPIPPALLALWQGLARKPDMRQKIGALTESISLDELRLLVNKHSYNAPYDSDDGDSFIKIGMAIHDATNGSDDGFRLWSVWLSKGVKYDEGKDHLRTHWRSFSKGKGVTWKWLRKGTTVDACDFSPLADVDDIDLTDEANSTANHLNEKPQPPVAAPVPDKSQPTGWPKLRRKKNGRIEPNYNNIYEAVNSPDFCGMHMGFDQFKAELQQAPAGSNAAALAPFGDNHYGQLRRALEVRGFESTGVGDVRQAVAEVAVKNSFDSARDWLESCQHDGAPRCATFLRDYLGAEDTDYSRAVSLYLWTALAGRVLEPGCQADMAVILVGRQGCRKSTSVAALVPKPEQFVELSLDQEDDDLARQMSGCLVGELSELRGLTTRDLESIKSFITRKHEKWVPKYKEFASTYARRLILVGTTNKREFLADDTGERRFLPVAVTRGRPEAIQRDLTQLWAEARDLFGLLGVSWQRAELLGAEATKDYKIADSWEDLVLHWLSTGDFEGSTETHGERGFTTADVTTGALGYEARHVNRGIEMRISKIISGLGYEQIRTRNGSTKVRLWEKK